MIVKQLSFVRRISQIGKTTFKSATLLRLRLFNNLHQRITCIDETKAANFTAPTTYLMIQTNNNIINPFRIN